MIAVEPVTLAFNGVRLEPLGHGHADGLRAAARDGELWKLRITSVPEPETVETYIATALEMRPARLAFAVIDIPTGQIVGTTSYHDIVPAIGRVEIGYTWYAKSRQRSHVNTSCKRMLLAHAFDTLGCAAADRCHPDPPRAATVAHKGHAAAVGADGGQAVEGVVFGEAGDDTVACIQAVDFPVTVARFAHKDDGAPVG